MEWALYSALYLRIGMSEEVKQKIFEPFYTTKEVGEGTGLGMSIAHTILNNHDAKVEVESEEGVGTTFVISIPIKER